MAWGEEEELGNRKGRSLSLRLAVGSGALAATLFLHYPANAQQGDNEQGSRGLEEIVVTAQRREQSLQDVPIAITAFSEARLERYNINDAQGYLSLTPNVAYGEEGERGARSLQISIRGIGNLGGLDIGSDAVGVFYDEVNVNTVSQGTFNPMMHDIQRVEVLRGPQGTYFGTNASGGALSILPNKPQPTSSASVELSAGNYGAWGLGTVVNTPITDNFYSRMVAYYEVSPGIVENVNPVGGDSSGRYKDFRYSVRWLPTDRWVIDGSVTYNRIDEGVPELVPTGVLPPNTARLTPDGFEAIDDGLGFYPVNKDRVNNSVYLSGVRQRPFFDTEATFVTASAEYSGERFNVKAISGYIDTSSRKLYDQDKTSFNFALVNDDYDTTAWSQEIRFSSTGEGRLNWVAGGIWLTSENSARRHVQADEEGFFPFQPGVPINRRLGITEVDSFAFFGDLTWDFTDRLSASLGLRYADDEYEQRQVQTTNARPPNVIIEVPDVVGGASSDDLSPRLYVTWSTSEEVTTYATISKGYRPGGVRLNSGVPPAPYKKEDLWNYEIGIKGQFLDSRLQASLALFYMDWQNAQFESGVFLQDDQGQIFSITGTENTNAVSEGVEFEFAALVTNHLTLNGGFGYLDARFKEASTARAAGVPVDLTDMRLPKAPKWTLNASAAYLRPLGNTGLDWFAQLEWKKRTETVGNLDAYAFLGNPPGTDPWPYLEPAWDVTNLRFGIEDERWSVTAHVENLFDDNYYTGTRNGLHLGGTMVRPHPRLFEVRAMYTF